MSTKILEKRGITVTNIDVDSPLHTMESSVPTIDENDITPTLPK